MKFVVLLLLVTTAVLISGTEFGMRPLKIAIMATFPTRSHSPSLEFADELVARGHQVDYLNFDVSVGFADQYSGVRKVSLGESPIGPKIWKEKMEMNAIVEDFFEEYKNLVDVFVRFYRPTFRALERIYADEPLPDVFICDMFAEVCMDFARSRNVNYMIQIIGSPGTFGHGDAPYIPPSIMAMPLNMSFVQRFETKFLGLARFIKAAIELYPPLDKARREMGIDADAVPVMNLFTGRHILFNSFFGFDAPRDTMSSLYHMVGPLVERSYAPLTPELRSWLDEALAADEAVVAVAFGSSAVLSDAQRVALIEGIQSVAQTRPVRFVIASKQSMSSDNPRVRVLPYLPLQAVLAHPATKLLVSHGGLNTIHEAIIHKVAMVLLPLFGDQPGNAYRAMEHGFAKMLNKKTVTASDVRDALLASLEPQYQASAAAVLSRLSALALINARRGRQLAADTVEMVGLGLGDLLVPNNQRIPLWRAQNYDIWALLLCTVVAVLVSLLLCARAVVRLAARRVFGRRVTDSKQKQQ